MLLFQRHCRETERAIPAEETLKTSVKNFEN